MFHIEYDKNNNCNDPNYWLPTALINYFMYSRTDLFESFKDKRIIISKGLHYDALGKIHFTFHTEDVTYHAYTNQLQIMFYGNIKTIGCQITRITLMKVVDV